MSNDTKIKLKEVYGDNLESILSYLPSGNKAITFLSRFTNQAQYLKQEPSIKRVFNKLGQLSSGLKKAKSIIAQEPSILDFLIYPHEQSGVDFIKPNHDKLSSELSAICDYYAKAADRAQSFGHLPTQGNKTDSYKFLYLYYMINHYKAVYGTKPSYLRSDPFHRAAVLLLEHVGYGPHKNPPNIESTLKKAYEAVE